METEVKNILITGFPGFVASYIVKLLKDRNDVFMYLLTRDKSINKGKYYIKKHNIKNAKVIKGDIEKENLGISKRHNKDLQKVNYIFHLAAIYDLSIEREKAYQTNVVGTKNALDFARKYNIENFVHFSTAYVSGTLEGIIQEERLNKGQSFKNFYEETKFLAEELVWEYMKENKALIIRPSIIVGDSKTGETNKFDGPYFFMKLICLLPDFIPIPYIGYKLAHINLIPVDFVARASIEIAFGKEENYNKAYHLSDPTPPYLRNLYREIVKKLKNQKPTFTVPLSLVELLFPLVKTVINEIPDEILDYFKYDAVYDTSNTQKAINFKIPSIWEYLDSIIKYFKKHIKEC